jgi:formiminotetrahydrofolate cyclodeaminase
VTGEIDHAALMGSSLRDLLDALEAGRVDSAAGSSAAVTAAMAAALAGMAGREMDSDASGGAVAQAASLRARLNSLAEQSAAAYRRARDLLDRAEGRRPGELSADEEDRSALGPALLEAADVPLAICEAAGDVVELAVWVARDGPADRRPDAVAAAFLAEAAAAAAAELVHVNLAVMPDDERAERARRLVAATESARRALAAGEG